MIPAKSWFITKLREPTKAGQLLRKIRRFCIGTFRPKYVRSKILVSRQGNCRRCGACCQFVYKCPFLVRGKDNKPSCLTYKIFRPANCKVYPIDSLDIEVRECGFSFSNVKSEDQRRV